MRIEYLGIGELWLSLDISHWWNMTEYSSMYKKEEYDSIVLTHWG